MTWLKNPSLIGALGVVGAVLGLLPSCVGTADTVVHADAKADFSGYRTFALVPTREPLNPDATPEVLRAFDHAVEEAFLARGLRRAADPGQADLLVLAHGGPREVAQLPELGFGYGQFRPWGYGGGAHELDAPRAGAVLVDAIDARTRQLVWRGMTRAPVAPEPIAASVRAVAAQFPRAES